MGIAVVTGSGGLIGSESVAHFVRRGLRRDRARERHAGRASSGRTPPPTRSPSGWTAAPGFPLARRRHPRRRRRGARVRRARVEDRAGGAHRRSAVPRLGGIGPADRLRGQRQRHAQPARVHAPALPRRHLRLHLHQQGLRRHAEPPAAGGAGHPPRAARRPPLLRRHRHHDDDRRLDALAVRRLEGGRRPDGPGVRALLRHAHRLLPRRLPHRPQPRRGEAARVPRPT